MESDKIVQTGILDLVGESGLVVKMVLLLLVVASAMCWTIVVVKYLKLIKARQENRSFLSFFWKSKSLDEIYSKSDEYTFSPVAIVFKAGFKELQKLTQLDRTAGANKFEIENIHRALARAATVEISLLEKYLTWLASTASAAPFIGLFGTVWGIMTSFQDIGATGSANLAVVAPGISEALIATAVGLFAAIPASIFYNQFINRIKSLAVDMECFTQDFLNIVQRGLLSGKK